MTKSNPITKDTPDFEAVVREQVYCGKRTSVGDELHICQPKDHCDDCYDKVIALLAAHNQAIEAAVRDFAEYCHEQYTGCAQTHDGYDYSYKAEVVTMAEQYFQLQTPTNQKGGE